MSTVSVGRVSSAPQCVGCGMVSGMAKDMFDLGFRVVDDTVVGGHRVVVLTGSDKRVTDVLVFKECEHGHISVVDAFKRGSFFDNFTGMPGRVMVGGVEKDLPERCVENAVFMGLKYMLAQSGVQILSTDDEPTRKKLVDSVNAIPDAVKKLLQKKPELDVESDPLVQAVKAWPTEPLSMDMDLSTLKKEWIRRNKVVLDCFFTNPKLGKLGVGRALSMDLIGDRFFDDKLGLPDAAIALTRASYLLCHETAFAFCMGINASEEISDCDAKYALKVEAMPDGMGVLDFFLPDGDVARKEALVKHMVSDAPAFKLGQANVHAMEIAFAGWAGLPMDKEGPAIDVLRSIGWDFWFNTKVAKLDDDVGYDIFTPAAQFKCRGLVHAMYRDHINIASVLDALKAM